MKFRYYIADLHVGAVIGTNDKELAEAYALSEDSFVFDIQSGMWLSTCGEQEIKEVRDEIHT